MKINQKINAVIKQVMKNFGHTPKFDDLADYLPFICAFGEYDFTRLHIKKLEQQLNSSGLIDFDNNNILMFSKHYEILLGLIEIYRILGDNEILELAVKMADACITKFVWRNGPQIYRIIRVLWD